MIFEKKKIVFTEKKNVAPGGATLDQETIKYLLCITKTSTVNYCFVWELQRIFDPSEEHSYTKSSKMEEMQSHYLGLYAVVYTQGEKL